VEASSCEEANRLARQIVGQRLRKASGRPVYRNTNRRTTALVTVPAHKEGI
jgi:hypothetical protein